MARPEPRGDFFGRPVAAHVPAHLIRHIDLFHGAEMNGDPFSIVGRLHREPRIVYYIDDPTFGQSWMPTRAKEIRHILLNPKIFSSDHQAGFSALAGEDWRLACVEMDAPDHTRFRRLMNPWFAPSAVTRLSETVRARARRLIDAVLDKGGCEFMSAYGELFPVSIFLDLMGLPQDQMAQFLEWAGRLLHDPDPVVKARNAMAIRDYLRELMADRRRHPRDDIATWAVQASFDGVPLTDDDIMGIYFVLFTGGLDTVAASLGFHFRHLASHPEYQQYLRDNPTNIPQAVEEYLRMFSPVQSKRRALEDVEIGGAQMKEGDWITILHALGSRDPEEFENPDIVDIDRRNNRHFGFATGPHMCIGASLARRELQITLEEWLGRVPPFQVKPGTIPETRGGIIFGVTRLDITWS